MNNISKALITSLLLLFMPLSISISYADELSDLREVVMQQKQDIKALTQRLTDMDDNQRSRFGWNLGIFGDVNYSTNSRERPNNSFFLGNLSLYSTATYGERLNFLVEIDFETQDEEVEIERGWVGYTFSDLLIVRAGKHHAALGYWNKTYHHGKQLFPSLDRPFFLAFEHGNGVLPIHIVGIEAEGSKSFGFGRVKYELEIGNGPSLADASGASQGILHPNNSSDDNDNKQPVVRISVKPSAVQGLCAGLFGTTYEVNTTSKKGVIEDVYGMDVSYSNSGLDITSEGFMFHNPDGDGNALYVQAAYTKEVWTPYIRFERLEVQEPDPYFRDLTGGIDRSQTIAGIKYDLDPLTSSIKLQYRRDYSARDSDVFETQWAFHF